MATGLDTSFALFDTAIGPCGIAWNGRGVAGVQLPEGSQDETRARLRRRFPDAREGTPPAPVRRAIDGVVALLQSNATDVMATLRRRVTDMTDLANPSVVKLVADKAGYALYFTRSAVPYVRPGQPAPVFWRHLGLYAYRRAFLQTLAGLTSTPLEQAEGLEQLRALEHGYRISTAETQADTIGVDTPEDLERVRQFVAAGALT